MKPRESLWLALAVAAIIATVMWALGDERLIGPVGLVILVWLAVDLVRHRGFPPVTLRRQR